MKNGLEVQMKEMLDAASLQELMPDFDQENLWTEVEAMLPGLEAKRRKNLFPWLAAAAALLLAVVTTCSLLRFEERDPVIALTSNQSEPAPVMKVTARPSNFNNQPIQTRGIAQQLPQPLHQQHGSIRQSPPSVALPAKASNDNSATQAIAMQPDKAPMVPANAPHKVVHYLDLDDDASEAPALAKETANQSFIQLKLNKPEYAAAASQQKPFKEIAFALGK